MEKIYESRRTDLKSMIDQMGRGAIAKVATDIEVDPNYLSRCLYPPGKKGKKNIGDEMVIKLNEKYPQWSTSWKSGFIEGEPVSVNVVTKPTVIHVTTPPPPTAITELVRLAGNVSDEGLKMILSYAYHVETTHPAQAKQTPESIG